MNPSLKWAAQLSHVREVSLFGTADLAYWKDRLLAADLVPTEQEGSAQVLISAADARFIGLRFQELSFSVLVSYPKQQPRHHGAFLLQAFNSRRLFAFCERVLFSTPYLHGKLSVSTNPPFMRLVEDGNVVFNAELAGKYTGPARQASYEGDDGWEGPIFLPNSRRAQGRTGRWFYARLHGKTRRNALEASRDALTIGTTRRSDVLNALIDSHFRAKEWIIREDAKHAKSKTYGVEEMQLLLHALPNQ